MRGKFSKDHFDQRVLNTLMQLTPEQASQAIDELENTDLNRIRNFAAYFMVWIKALVQLETSALDPAHI